MDVGHVDGDAGAELRLDLVLICLLLLVLLRFWHFGWRPRGVRLTGTFLLFLRTRFIDVNLVDLCVDVALFTSLSLSSGKNIEILDLLISLCFSTLF